MGDPGVAGAADQVDVGQGGALLDQRPGHRRLVAQQQPRQGVRQFRQRGQTQRHPPPLLDRGLAQQVHHQVARHRPLEGVDPAGGQADDVRQPPQQRLARFGRPRRGVFVRNGGQNRHGPATLARAG
ncbi:hypothetical protein D3C80_1254160 [compost metagenome]